MQLIPSNDTPRSLPKLGLAALSFLALSLIFNFHAIAQPGPPGGGGPNSADKKIVADFDTDGDGILNRSERDEARKMLQQAQGRNDRRGKRGGPPGGRGKRGNRPAGKPGPAVTPADVENYADAGLYDQDVLRTIFIDFEHDDWEQEMAIFKPTDVEIPATLTVDGVEYPNVGMSFRGASSFFMVPEGSKRSLNLSMDFVDDEQRLDGYKSLNLLNGNGDRSMMSSYLYSNVAKQQIPTPKVNFVKVVINGRSWGIYANAQQFNKDFLEENYGTRKGNRWKVNGSPRGDAGLRYLGDDVEEYQSRFEIKSKDNPQAWKDLIHLCKVLNETPTDQLITELEPILDIDGALCFLAAHVGLINSDGYWVRASDYSIYQDPDGQFHILPHDMNESFRASRGGRGGPKRSRGRQGRGGQRGPGGPPPGEGPPPGFDGPPPQRGKRSPGEPQRTPPNQQQSGGYALDPLVGMEQDRFPLRSKLLANPTLRTRYLQHLRTIAEDHIAWEQLGPQVADARKLIESDVYEDTRKLMSDEDFTSSTDPKSPATPGSLREFAEKRSRYLLNHPAIKDLPRDMIKLPKTSSPSPESQGKK